MRKSLSKMKTPSSEMRARLETCALRAGGKKNLALACEISLPQLFRYIKGDAVLPVDRLLKISRASNVHPYWLLTGEGAPDAPPIHSFLSTEQKLAMDAKSLTESLLLADEIDKDYQYAMTPQRKAELVFALYQGAAYESRLTGNPVSFQSSKALEIQSFLSGIQGEIPRSMLLNTVEIVTKASDGRLPDKEIRTFCNYLNSAIKDFYNSPKSIPYYDRIGYALEPDTMKFVDELVNEVKTKHQFRNELIQVLDLGCGTGRHLLHLYKDKRLKVTGIDSNPYGKKICEDYEASGKLAKGTFVEGDMFRLPFADGSFDMVFANASIFHTPFLLASPHGLNQVMQEVWRVLKPKGKVYIHSRYGSGFEPFPFFQLHNEGSIRQLCQKNAFQLVWFKTFFWPDSIEYIPKVNFNHWFSALLSKES